MSSLLPWSRQVIGKVQDFQLLPTSRDHQLSWTPISQGSEKSTAQLMEKNKCAVVGTLVASGLACAAMAFCLHGGRRYYISPLS